jgi:hypothetical protein
LCAGKYFDSRGNVARLNQESKTVVFKELSLYPIDMDTMGTINPSLVIYLEHEEKSI